MTSRDGAPPSVSTWSLTEKQRLVVTWATVTTVLLAAAGVLAAAFVLCRFSLPAMIEHDGLNKFGQPIAPENALVYLFVLPVFQCWLAFIGVLQSRRARAGESNLRSARLEATLKARFPGFDLQKETAAAHEIFSVGIAFVQFNLLPFSIYRAVFVAMHAA